MASIPFISVVLAAYNEENYIEKCLKTILNQDYPKDKMEILVVDGMSEDGTREILNKYAERYSNIKIVDNPDKITPKGFNIGIKTSRGENIAIVSMHSTLARDYISKCVEFLNKTGADNVGGLCKHVGDSFVGRAIALAQGCKFGLGGAKFRTAKKEQYVDTVFPGFWPKRVFEKIGLFDERLIRNQDIEFNSRIIKNSGKIFLTPEIISYYYCRSNLKDLWEQNFKNGFWNIKTLKIAPGSLSLRHFVPLFFVLGLLTSWIIKPVWFVVVVSYVLCNFFFSFYLSLMNGLKYLFILPIVFLTLHLSYGIGTLVGILSFIRKR